MSYFKVLFSLLRLFFWHEQIINGQKAPEATRIVVPSFMSMNLLKPRRIDTYIEQRTTKIHYLYFIEILIDILIYFDCTCSAFYYGLYIAMYCTIWIMND